MNILVTGGQGFIGVNFIQYIFEKHPDYRIVNLDKLTYAANKIWFNSHIQNYRFVKGDICDIDLVDILVADCDIVVHFAAESHVDRSITGPAEFVRTNVIGTQVLLDACVKHKKRFHHVSTDEVFGSLSLSDERFTENSPYDPSSPYSASKASSDHLVRAYHRTYGLETTITNCSNNYGPWQHREKLIPLMITNALENKPLPVYGSGINVRDWIYVRDHCSAIDLVIHSGKIGETYLVGGNEERSNMDVVGRILFFMHKPDHLIRHVEDRKGHDLRYAINSSKIEEELRWKRMYSFDLGLRETISWYTDRASLPVSLAGT